MNSAAHIDSMTLEEFQAACKAQAPSNDLIVFCCPMCKTLQTGRELMVALEKPFEEVERYLGFSCIGRFTGAGSARKPPDGCNWTLGGLFKLHEFEVVTPDGRGHPRFALASREEADVHRSKIGQLGAPVKALPSEASSHAPASGGAAG